MPLAQRRAHKKKGIARHEFVSLFVSSSDIYSQVRYGRPLKLFGDYCSILSESYG
jgi:hypothetical protein